MRPTHTKEQTVDWTLEVVVLPVSDIDRSIALSMSNRVRQATETAVSASISTPVTPVVFTSASTLKPRKRPAGMPGS